MVKLFLNFAISPNSNMATNIWAIIEAQCSNVRATMFLGGLSLHLNHLIA